MLKLFLCFSTLLLFFFPKKGGGGAESFTRLTFYQTELLPNQKFIQSEFEIRNYFIRKNKNTKHNKHNILDIIQQNKELKFLNKRIF